MDLNFGDWEGKLSDIAFPAAFVFQITRKDIAFAQGSGYWDGLDWGTRAEFIANIILGRTVGFNPFPKVSKYDPVFKPENAINPTSIFGAALYVAGELGIIPKRWGGIGKKIAMGGALGGLFDDAAVPQPGVPMAQAGTVYAMGARAISGASGTVRSHIQVGQR